MRSNSQSVSPIINNSSEYRKTVSYIQKVSSKWTYKNEFIVRPVILTDKLLYFKVFGRKSLSVGFYVTFDTLCVPGGYDT